MRLARRFHPALLLTAVSLLFCLPTHAALLPAYDLDTLIHLSSDIVDGVVVARPAGERPTDDSRLYVRVIHVYTGQTHAGQILPVSDIADMIVEQHFAPPGTPLQRREAAQVGGSQVLIQHSTHLGVGAHITLFLKADAEAPGKLVAVLSGVKVENKGHVNGFAQLMDPGPYVLIDHLEANATDPPPTPAKFRAMLAARLKVVRAMRHSQTRATTSASHIEKALPADSTKHG